MNDKNGSDDVIEYGKGIGILVGFTVGLGAAVPAVYYYNLPPVRHDLRLWCRRVIISSACAGVLWCAWYLWLDPQPLYWPDALYAPMLGKLKYKSLAKLVWVWICEGLAVFTFAPVIPLLKGQKNRVRLNEFRKPKINKNVLKKAFNNPLAVPIGIDVQTGEIETLDQKRRCSHVISVGATGTGKSTLMFNMILHAVKHGHPVLIMDPKGEMASLERFCEIGRKLCADFDKRFRLFSLGSPVRSASYNPLKHGNANEKKDRILEALNWSEQFYQSMSSSYLTTVLAAIEITNTHLTLDYLQRLAVQKELQSELKKAVKNAADGGVGNAETIFQMLDSLFARKGDEVLGLQAQITILNNPTIGHLLSFETAENEIDLREALEKNQIVYFQLNTLSNPDTGRRLGRMIIEDAKALAGHVYHTQPNENDRKFFPIFIDEFGSFAAKEFIEFLKQSRGAKFAVHMFCQGLEDLDVVSPEFRRQGVSNPMTTISLRVTDNETVNEIVAVAGTMDALEQSHQVEGGWLQTKTGRGNLRETKQVRVEHDVLRNLDNLQAVVIKKSPSEVRGIQIYFPEYIVYI